MKRNTIVFSRIDREDFWITGAISFKVNNTETYEDAYNEIKDKLETPEVIQYIIDDYCLLDDLFDGDETYKFVKTYWSSPRLYFVFENSEGNVVEHKKSADFILVL